MDSVSGGWDYDISLINYTSIPVYMVGRDQNGSRLNNDMSCTAPAIYSGAGAHCHNEEMIKDCPTKVEENNCMSMCLSPIKLCEFGKNSSHPVCLGATGNMSDVFNKELSTPNVKFDKDFVQNTLGFKNETPQSFFYGNIAGGSTNGVDALAKDNNPLIYRGIISGINRGICPISEINNSSCNGLTNSSCVGNGGSGNLFPMLGDYRVAYQKHHPSMTDEQKMTDPFNMGRSPCSNDKCIVGPYGFCHGNYVNDWSDDSKPHNVYAKWAASHGNGRVYTFPFDDDRGNINSGGKAINLDVVIFPDCGSWKAE